MSPDRAQVESLLAAVKNGDAATLPAAYAAALGPFRFLAPDDRREVAEEFDGWVTTYRAGVPHLQGYGVFLRGLDRFMAEDHAAGLPLLTAARQVFLARNDPGGLGLTAMLTGATYRTLGHFELALTTLWEGYELLLREGHYPAFVGAAANSIANIALEMGHLDEAARMFRVAHEQSVRADDFYFTVYALHGLGKVQMALGHPREAAEMFQQALALAEREAHPLHVANSLTELANLRFHGGDLEDAEALSLRALALREAEGFPVGIVTNALRLAEIHGRRGEWTAALPILERALTVAERLGIKPKQAQVHERLSELYERTGDLERSLAHHKRFHALRAEVEKEDGARRLADSRMVFEAEQRRKENAVIRAQKEEIEAKNRELQETIDELTRARVGRRARAYTLGLAILLFVFQDAILGTALRLLDSHNYFVLLGVKMAIIFSLSPINRAIERVLLRRVLRQQRAAAGATPPPPAAPEGSVAG